MSLTSLPSLISDSASLASSDDLHDTHNSCCSASITSLSNTASYLDTSNHPEIHTARTGVSKVERQKHLLEGYASELQSRIRHIEQERLALNPTINEPANASSSRLDNSKPTDMALVSPPDTNIPSKAKAIPTHRKYHSLSAVASSTSRGSAMASRSDAVKASEVTGSAHEASVGPSTSQFNSMTPTRRRLQAMRRLFSSSESAAQDPSLQSQIPNGKSAGRLTQSLRLTKPSGQDKKNDSKSKPASKLDSVFITSKLFPLPSHSKVPVLASEDPTCPAIVPIVPSPKPNLESVCRTSPPRKAAKVEEHRKASGQASTLSSVDENAVAETSQLDNKPMVNPPRKPRGRVSFSDYPPELRHEQEQVHTQAVAESEKAGKAWGSWSKKASPAPLSTSSIKDKETTPSSQPASPRTGLFRFNTKSSMDNSDIKPEDPRKPRRRSLAPQCLRTLMLGANDISSLGPPNDATEVPSDPRPMASLSRNSSRRSSKGGNQATDEKSRISPSRVGSPIIRSTKQPDTPMGYKLERTNSMRTAGKYGQRDMRVVTPDVGLRHPMFSFERPGSTDSVAPVVNTKSSASANSKSGGKKAITGVSLSRVPTVEKSLAAKGKLPAMLKPPSLSSSTMKSPPPPSPLDGQRMQGDAASDQAPSRSDTAHSDQSSASKQHLMRSRMGVTHGTFDFEPAASAVFEPPRRVQGPTLIKGPSLSSRKTKIKLSSSPKTTKVESPQDEKAREWDEFCRDLKRYLGEGVDWESFTNYTRRYDMRLLTADILLQRVERLISCRRNVDEATRKALYERFVEIVRDSLR